MQRIKTMNRTQTNFFFVSDIDECKIPELARKCVENDECCNLPAEYVCKCKPGFEGDGQVECRSEWMKVRNEFKKYHWYCFPLTPTTRPHCCF